MYLSYVNWKTADRLDLTPDVIGGSKTEVAFAFLYFQI